MNHLEADTDLVRADVPVVRLDRTLDRQLESSAQPQPPAGKPLPVCLKGGEPRVIIETLGHFHIATTMNIHAHVLPVRQRRAADRMDDLLSGEADDRNCCQNCCHMRKGRRSTTSHEAPDPALLGVRPKGIRTPKPLIRSELWPIPGRDNDAGQSGFPRSGRGLPWRRHRLVLAGAGAFVTNTVSKRCFAGHWPVLATEPSRCVPDDSPVRQRVVDALSSRVSAIAASRWPGDVTFDS